MNRQRLNLVLVVVALALVAAVVLSQKKDEQKAPLTALKSAAITQISLEHAGKPRIALAKHNGSWSLTEPVAVGADSLAVNTLLGVAEAPVQSKLDAQQVKLSDIGLDPPLFTLTLDKTVVRFGGTEPLNFRRYVQTGDTLSLIEDINGPAFDADYSDLVSKSLVPEGSEISRIELPGLSVTRDGDSKSWAATPAGGDAATALAFADRWRNARAMWTQASENGTPTGEPLNITTQDGVLKFLIVARDPQLTIERPDLKLRYVLSKADVDRLLKLQLPPQPAGDSAAPQPATKP